MRKEIGKWLMDIAKYIMTAIILSSLFGDVEPVILYIGGAVAFIVTLSLGLLCISDCSLRFRRRRRPRNNNSQNT